MSVFRPSLNEHGLTEQQWRIIRILERYGELEIYQLAELACILKPSMTGVLVRMEAAGMVRQLASLGGVSTTGTSSVWAPISSSCLISAVSPITGRISGWLG
jgi:hypothetical protein